MKITIVGAGHVGLIVAAGFSSKGNIVTCVDKNKNIIRKLRKGAMSFYEPNLNEMIEKSVQSDTLYFTSSFSYALKKCDICFLTVGTPIEPRQTVNLSFLYDAVDSLMNHLKESVLLVIKSTVPIGTSRKIKAYIHNRLLSHKLDVPIMLVFNPEFISEGNGCNDFLFPDRVIIGADDERAAFILKQAYQSILPVNTKYLFMGLESAELTKYASNCMLASRISFINEIAHICTHFNADIKQVQAGIGADSRIGEKYLSAGCGYGGSCLPKDVKALIAQSISVGYNPRLLRAIDSVNDSQKMLITHFICNKFGKCLNGFRFAIWGIAFKPQTDDVREAVSVVLIHELTKRGAELFLYDPIVKAATIRHEFSQAVKIHYCNDKYRALDGAYALIVLTEWEEFQNLDFEELKTRMKGNIIIDGRNIFNKNLIKSNGFSCIQIGTGD